MVLEGLVKEDGEQMRRAQSKKDKGRHDAWLRSFSLLAFLVTDFHRALFGFLNLGCYLFLVLLMAVLLCL